MSLARMTGARTRTATLAVVSLLVVCQLVAAGPPVCNIPADVGSSYSGTFRGGVQTVQLSVGLRSLLVFTSSTQKLYLQSSRWEDDILFVSELARTDVFGAEIASQCNSTSFGNYTYSSNDGCQTINFRRIYDSCAARGDLLNSMSVSLQPRAALDSYAAVCAIATSDVFRSNTTTGAQVTMNFLPGGSLMVNTSTGDLYVLHATPSTNNGKLELSDVWVAPTNALPDVCNSSIVGVYTVIWTADCVGFKLRVDRDECDWRLIQFNQLAVSRAYTPKKYRLTSQLAGNWDNPMLVRCLIVLLACLVGAVCLCVILRMSKEEKKKPAPRYKPPKPDA